MDCARCGKPCGEAALRVTCARHGRADGGAEPEPSPKDFVLLAECGLLYNKIGFFSSYPGDGVDVFRGPMVSSVSVQA